MISLKTVLLILFLILFTHALATVGNWYWAAPWFDMPMHFVGGLWAAILFFYLNEKFFKISNKLTIFITSISFVSLIGILWEFFEYVYSLIFSSSQISLFLIPMNLYRDTLGDLFFDLLGAIIFYLIFLMVDRIRHS
jgi:uncharacterized membrane protein YjdF